jgi:hypothetical protein
LASFSAIYALSYEVSVAVCWGALAPFFLSEGILVPPKFRPFYASFSVEVLQYMLPDISAMLAVAIGLMVVYSGAVAVAVAVFIYVGSV